ncbi:DUF45 domain-containing protein [Mycoplasmatota bacterium WC30]
MNKIRLGNKDFYYQVFYKNNKNMYLRIKEGRLIVTCNRIFSEEQIRSFIYENSVKILNKFRIYESKVALYSETSMLIYGNEYAMVYKISCKKNNYSFYNNTVHLEFRKEFFDKNYVEKVYSELIINKAIEILNELRPLLEISFDLNNIQFKTQLMKSRFGSCIPQKKIIKLNTMLGRFDELYIRVILIHEIIHLKVPNHSKEFYDYMHAFIPEYKQIKKELNNLMRKYVI